MSNLNPNQFGPLYHGSSTVMKPGTVLKPGAEGVAFATSHRDTAALFANNNRSIEAAVGEPKSRWKQDGIFNPVYQVSPVDSKSTNFGVDKSAEYATSEKGFKIDKVHSWTSQGEKLTPAPSTIAEHEARVKKAKTKPGI